MLKKDSSSLVHSAIWNKVESAGGPFDDSVFKAYPLEGIRLSVTRDKIAFSTSGAERSDEITLFYFPGLSSVDGDNKTLPTFVEGDTITALGVDYVVKGVRQVFDATALHHLEVTLE